jgi:hypothetical protein
MAAGGGPRERDKFVCLLLQYLLQDRWRVKWRGFDFIRIEMLSFLYLLVAIFFSPKHQAVALQH